MTRNQDRWRECRLRVPLPFDIYQRIASESLFNLKPELRGPLSGDELQPGAEVHIELALQPDILPQLARHASTAEQAVAYLVGSSRDHAAARAARPDNVVDITSRTRAAGISPPDVDPLLFTENWLCLSVAQHRGSGSVGYKTFWHYLMPMIHNQDDVASDEIAEAILGFVKDWARFAISETDREDVTEMLRNIGGLLDGLLEDAISSTGSDGDPASLLDAARAFFERDDWPFVNMPEDDALFLSYSGNSGQWSCCAMAQEAQRQLLFYSVCPVAAPEHKRQAMAEFIARANYGVVLGNFELDFGDGELRYKTSIDVEGDRLTDALLKQVVYSNVIMMDHYLPAILAVIERGVAPEVAIAQVEGVDHRIGEA